MPVVDPHRVIGEKKDARRVGSGPGPGLGSGLGLGSGMGSILSSTYNPVRLEEEETENARGSNRDDDIGSSSSSTS